MISDRQQKRKKPYDVKKDTKQRKEEIKKYLEETMHISPAYIDYALDLVWLRIGHHIGPYITPSHIATLCQEVVNKNSGVFKGLTSASSSSATLLPAVVAPSSSSPPIAAAKKQQQQTQQSGTHRKVIALRETPPATLDLYCKVNEACDRGDVVGAVEWAIKLGDMELVMDIVRKSHADQCKRHPTSSASSSQAQTSLHDTTTRYSSLQTPDDDYYPQQIPRYPLPLQYVTPPPLPPSHPPAVTLPPIAAIFTDVAAEMASENYIRKTSVSCPHCGIFVQHFRGHSCHHLTCGRCKRDFCYACGKLWDERHLDVCDLYCGGDAELLLQSPFSSANVAAVTDVACSYPLSACAANNARKASSSATCRCLPCDSCQVGKPCDGCDGNCPVCRGKIPQGNYFNKIV